MYEYLSIPSSSIIQPVRAFRRAWDLGGRVAWTSGCCAVGGCGCGCSDVGGGGDLLLRCICGSSPACTFNTHTNTQPAGVNNRLGSLAVS